MSYSYTTKKKKFDKFIPQLPALLIAVFLPALIFLVTTICSDIMPGYGQLFIFGDGLHQFSIFSKEFMNRLFSHESLVYSFKNGMGMPTVAINAFYSQSPFNIFYLVINDIEIASFCVVIAKLMFTSLCMYLLLKRIFKISSYASVFFSTAYSLCSFFAFFSISFELLDMLYILPLIVLGINRFLQYGKWGWLCIIYAYSFIIHFYTAYMTGIFSFVIFIAYTWYLYGRTSILWKKALSEYFKCVFIATLIAAPLLIPAGYELISMRATDADKLNKFVLYPWEFLAGLYPAQCQSINNTIPYIYSGIPALLLSSVFFFDTNISKRTKYFAGIPLVFLVLCSFLKPLYLFMHAFDAPNGYAFRFSCFFCFCMILTAAKEYETICRKGIVPKTISIIALIYVLIYAILYCIPTKLNPAAQNINPTTILLLFCITTLYVITLKRCTGKFMNKAVFILLLVAELSTNLLQGQKKLYNPPPSRYDYTIACMQAENCLDEIKKHEATDPWMFYRVHYLNSLTDNISMLYDFHGIGWFCSIENEKIRHILNKFGYASTNLVAYDYGSTPLMQMLFAQKYSMECGYIYSDRAPYYLFKKKDYTLPLGYMVSSDMLDYNIPDINPFEAQNSLVNTMCGTKHCVYTIYDGVCYVEPQNIDLITYDAGTKVRLTDDYGQITYSIPANQDGKTYAYMYRWGISELVNNSPIIHSNTDIGGMDRLSDISLPHIIEMSPDDDGLCRLYIEMNAAETPAFDYESIYFAYEDADEIAAVYSDLVPGAMTVTSFLDDQIEATVTATSDKPLLFTTIPYDKSWHVYCDNTELKTYPILDDAFLGVVLEKGTHNIHFVYKSKWVYLGRAIGIAGIILFLLSIGISRISKSEYRRYQ